MNSRIPLLFLFLLLMLGTEACYDRSPIFSLKPEIEFISLLPDTIREPIDLTKPGPENTAYLKIGFKDGDGDLGYPQPDPNHYDLFLIDQRPNATVDTLKYHLPFLSRDEINPSIQGEITVELNNLLRYDASAPYEEVRFWVYIVDRAGNQSNVVETTPLIILPP